MIAVHIAIASHRTSQIIDDLGADDLDILWIHVLVQVAEAPSSMDYSGLLIIRTDITLESIRIDSRTAHHHRRHILTSKKTDTITMFRTLIVET